MASKVKGLFEKYGKLAIYVYGGVYIAGISGCFIAVDYNKETIKEYLLKAGVDNEKL